MSIVAQQTTVYLAPTAGRRFLTKAAAINKEARAIIKSTSPTKAVTTAATNPAAGATTLAGALRSTSRSVSSATTEC